MSIVLSVAVSLAISAAMTTAPAHSHLRWIAGGAVARLHQGDDSLGPMVAALDSAQLHPQSNVYEEVVIRTGRRFQYSTASLLPIYLWRTASRFLGGVPVERAFLWLSWISVWAVAGAAAYLFRVTVGAGLQRLEQILFQAAVVLMSAAFGPLLCGFQLGQVQVVLNAGIGLMFVFWFTGSVGLAGVVAGILCVFKPHFAVLLLWGLSGRQKRFSAAMALTSGSLILWSILAFGGSQYLHYLRFLNEAAHGHVYFANQSWNGLVNRQVHSDMWFLPSPADFARADTGVAVSSALFAFALIVCAILRARSRAHRPGPAELAIVLLSITLASPVAWEHHYGFLPIIFAMALAGARSWGLRAAAAAAYILTADLFFFSRSTAFWNNLLISNIWIGSLVLLAVLYRMPSAARRGEGLA